MRAGRGKGAPFFCGRWRRSIIVIYRGLARNTKYTPLTMDVIALSPPRKARVEIIPLIDVVFFLLATFVLFTLALEKLAVLAAPFPEAKINPVFTEDGTVYIQAADAGMFRWKLGRTAVPELLSAAEIRPRLMEYKRTAPAPRVMICGDGKAKLGPAVMLLDEVRRAEIDQVCLETVAGAFSD